ncbi:hypothetical protein ND856_13710 [Leptospira bandrabouensis]|uniref:hypothetical protein n=1 Tax=Leptospira bandrabouensis TaxID=2484903 RepID=UPI00223D9ACD|nr:hypothetical protein [Leptospira bandrabouensis]MCW7478345.1 hypothetical protein [Leptospira bandrabouensis]MCW7485533.1 hypothetical protein [Leptospira bandrabouensis]
MDLKERNSKITENLIPWWVWSIILISFSAVICYKLVISEFNFQFDFPTFLSLFLSLFSVGLAALFYFKATDTSNSFYDNTYKFTQEIASLLVKIESGFGEKLSHLDDAYKGMRQSFDQLPNRWEIKETKKEIKKEEEEVENIIKEKDSIINDLLSKAKLDKNESEKIFNELKAKDSELTQAQKELDLLKKSLLNERTQIIFNEQIYNLSRNTLNYLENSIIPEINPEFILSRPYHLVRKKFKTTIQDKPDIIKQELRLNKIIDSNGELTEEGFISLQRLARRMFRIR